MRLQRMDCAQGGCKLLLTFQFDIDAKNFMAPIQISDLNVFLELLQFGKSNVISFFRILVLVRIGGDYDRAHFSTSKIHSYDLSFQLLDGR